MRRQPRRTGRTGRIRRRPVGYGVASKFGDKRKSVDIKKRGVRGTIGDFTGRAYPRLKL